jgi:hypothetical protein
MSDELHKYPGNLKHHKVDEATATHLRIIADQAELIQQLVDAMYALRKSVRKAPYNTLLGFDNALDAADRHGFKPSEQ